MESKDRVVRQQSEVDRGATEIIATRAGLALAIVPIVEKAATSVLRGFTEDKSGFLRRMPRRIAQNALMGGVL